MVNSSKTSVMVYRAGAKIKQPKITYKDQPLETVNHFCLLGVTVNHNAHFNVAIREIGKKSRKAIHALEKIAYRHYMSVESKLYFFRSKVVPVITFGAEMWGADNFSDLSVLYMRTLKHILDLKTGTSNAMVLIETGLDGWMFGSTENQSNFRT